MNRILEIAVKVFLLLIVSGFLGWVCYRSLRRSNGPARLIFKWIFTALVIGVFFIMAVPAGQKGGYDAIQAIIVTLIGGIAMAITWRHSLIDLIANPLGSLYDGGREEVEPKPFYSIALTKRKLNRPLEAIVEIRKQLAKFPNDFEGVTLLASVQAEDMKDLPGAEITFNHFCDRSEAPPKQVAAAWTQMADWHLKLAQDVDSARAVLEKIIARFPSTAVALQAAQRIAHLDGTEKILLASHDRQAM